MADRTDSNAPTSRVSGFYRRSLPERCAHIIGPLSPAAADHLAGGGGLPLEVADAMSENVVATHALPLSVALNFRIDGVDRIVPMATEEPSVVAAASNAARIVRDDGGFVGHATAPVMTAQVQLDGVAESSAAAAAIEGASDRILAAANAAIPRMLARGGGVIGVETRVLDADEGLVVVHLHVHVGDAMGANIVDTVAEAAAPAIQAVIGGQVGLRILTNLTIRRTVTVKTFLSETAAGGAEVTAAIARASRFGHLDPFRAATHNKGIMNGVDAVALALGQDFRAIEAGAHAFAALSGAYRPLSTWTKGDGGIDGNLTMPMAAATVGGATGVHPGVAAAFEILGVGDAKQLAVVMGAVGLASNLAALRALATEGIQRGHMRLHARKQERR